MSIHDIVGQYLLSRTECIPLVASENAVSGAVRKLCASEIGERYCVGPTAPWRYPKEAHLEKIVVRTQELASKIFGGKATTVAPLSGSQCVAAIVLGICKPGDLVMGVSHSDGGHWALRGMADKLQCQFEPLPLSGRAKVDCGKLAHLIKSHRPTLVMVDQSHSVEPIPPESIRSVLPAGVPLFYDVSHFMGLVPHEYLANPFGRGVTVLHGSTHKSLFGPQKGMIVFGSEADPDMIAKISSAAEKILSSNTHLHHVSALGQALEEYEAFGAAYSATVVKHSCLFAQTLQSKGLEVLSAQHSFTESHQVLVKFDGNAEAMWNGLTVAGILTNLICLPREDALGFRFGLAETARLGYTAPEIDELGLLVADLISGRRDAQSAKTSVKALSKRPRSMKFCFEKTSDRPVNDIA
jgi:glycine hydroxymethyltransferase